MGTTQANFRLSKEAAVLLKSTAGEQKLTKTEVLEYCIGRYAADLGIDTAKATAVILKQIATNIAASSQSVGAERAASAIRGEPGSSKLVSEARQPKRLRASKGGGARPSSPLVQPSGDGTHKQRRQKPPLSNPSEPDAKQHPK